MHGHFASTHAHVNTYIDISTVTCRHNNAREAARVLSETYLLTTKVDTIVCLDDTKLIGAYLAEQLSQSGTGSINEGVNISVVTPEIVSRGQMMFRDNTRRMIEGQDVLVLSGNIITGETMLRAINTVLFYSGKVVGVCAVFSDITKVAGVNVESIFTMRDVVGYKAFSVQDCPMCREGRKLDAIVNSYGYSLL